MLKYIIDLTKYVVIFVESWFRFGFHASSATYRTDWGMFNLHESLSGLLGQGLSQFPQHKATR